MKVKITGKESVHSSKNNKDYTVVHFAEPLKGENKEGTRGANAWLNGVNYPYGSIKVGATYNCDRDGSGRVVEFELIQ